MGRELRRRGVTHVVMEASGVYTDPVYYALAGLGFTEVMVINPAQAIGYASRPGDIMTRGRPGRMAVSTTQQASSTGGTKSTAR